MKKLPPLNALKAFEAAARHESFSKAADELFVTQGAISKQVKILEEYLGVTLFERKHQHVQLTHSGQRYVSAIRPALDSIENATADILNQPELLQINALPSLSSRWFIPLLEDFKQLYPSLSVTVTTGDGEIDFDKTAADIAIRTAKHSEHDSWKHLCAQKIMDEELVPVCSPRLKAALTQPQDLARHPLLRHTTRPAMWEEYLSAIGYADIAIRYGLGCEHFFMLIQAAEDGLGVALIPKFLIEKELERGSLVIAFHAAFTSPYAYYLIYPKPKGQLQKVRSFTGWMRKYIRSSGY